MSTETPEAYYCEHVRKCGWVGRREELKDRPDAGLGIKAFTQVCPKCGAESFYVRKDGARPPRGWKPKAPINWTAWISTNDSMPDDDQTVLIFVPGEIGITLGYRDGEIWRSIDGLTILDEVTHWMPMPEPPSRA